MQKTSNLNANPSSVNYQPNAKLSDKELVLLDWCQKNLSTEITVLAESRQDGIMMADIFCDGHFVEFKTTSGNLTTLDTLIRHAAKQAHGDCAIINLRRVSYSLEDAIQVATRRMQRSGLAHVYLLQDNVLAIHLYQKKGE